METSLVLEEVEALSHSSELARQQTVKPQVLEQEQWGKERIFPSLISIQVLSTIKWKD
jgi:hypothetical protein